jgi:hypothetical protein
MLNTNEDTTISEELWRVWRAKDKQRQATIARRLRVVTGVILGLVALGGVVYFWLAR